MPVLVLYIRRGDSALRRVQFNVSLLRMVINRALVVTIFLFGYGFAQSDTTENRTRLQAEATVEIQYDGQVGSGIILITSHPTSCTNLVSSNSSGTLSNSITTTSRLPTTMSIKTSLTSATPFNTPPSFGVSRTQMINATSTGQQLFSTNMGSSQTVTGATATQSLPEKSTPSTSQSSFIAGSGTRPGVSWSHVVFWAVVAELVTGFL
jgi:hypothetical protein